VLRWLPVLFFGLLLGCEKTPLDKARSLTRDKQHLEALKEFAEAVRTQPELAGEIVKEADAVVGLLMPEVKQHYEAGNYQDVVKLTGRMLAVRTSNDQAHLYDGLSRVAFAPDQQAQMGLALTSLNRHLRLVGRLGEQMTYPRYLVMRLREVVSQLPVPGASNLVQQFGKDIGTPFSTREDLGYVMRTLLYRQIAISAAGQAGDAEARARALFGWMLRNHQLGKGKQTDLRAKPVDVLLRGFGEKYGLCWTYAELARQLDLRAVLRLDPIVQPDGGPPSRPVQYRVFVTVWTGDKLLTFDLERGIEIRGPVDAKSRYLVVGEPRSYYPRMRILEDLLRKHRPADAPRLFTRPDETLMMLLQQVQGRKLGTAERSKLVFPITQKGKAALDLWAWPFVVDMLYRTNKQFKERMNPLREVIQQYQRPRLDQLKGDAVRAAEGYQALGKTKTIKDPGALRDCSYFRAVCLQDQGQTAKAVAAYLAHLKQFKDSPWQPQLQLRLGACYAELGQQKAARAAWALVKGPRVKWVEQLAAKAGGG